MKVSIGDGRACMVPMHMGRWLWDFNGGMIPACMRIGEWVEGTE